jgi:chemotaxis protein MotB
MKLFLFHAVFCIIACFMFQGCAELQGLRQIKAMQEGRISELEKQNNEYKDAFYKLKEEREKDKLKYSSEINSLSKENIELKTGQSERESRLRTDNDSLRRNLQSVTKELNTALDEIKSSKKKLSDLNKKYNSRISGLDSDLKVKDSELKKNRLEKESLISELSSLNRKVKTLENERKGIKARISILEKETSEKDKLISSLDSENKELKSSLKKSNNSSSDYKKIKAELEKSRKNLESIKKDNPAPDPNLKKAQIRFIEGLKTEISSKKITISSDRRGVVIKISSENVFETGSVIVSDEAGPLLLKISKLLNEFPQNSVLVEGHTDSIPIENLPFVDNLALSSARADNVVRFLTEEGNIKKTRMKSVACSWFKPAATNKNPEGRKKNRRVEIILAPK